MKSTALVHGEVSDTQHQTSKIFGFKWAKRDTYESPQVKANAKNWLFERYCGNDPSLLGNWLAGGRKVILDAGCGSGFTALLFFGELLKQHDYLGVDISDAMEQAKIRFSETGIPGDFLKSDLMNLPIPDGSIDMIYSEGVLHHTDSVRNALLYLTGKLKKGGIFLFYVYKKKSPVREFTDDYIRNIISSMPEDKAWEALMPLTRLGETLGNLNIEVDVPEDVELLGIPKGKIPLQRLFYWHFCKMYYRQEFSLDEMNHINFDWFMPRNCHRHSPEEIQAYCDEAGLEPERFIVEDAGISVVARKR
ncbi:MAG: methyltransferase [Lentisphaerae bacterium GWF2_52_8]|nr:MAG: methyltransferase [Lentisphaerae bacterium GWF2_52_8]